MARNRYGWEKRAKEIARKQKHEEKIKRRQNKNRAPEEEIATSEAGAGAVESTDPDNPEGAS